MRLLTLLAALCLSLSTGSPAQADRYKWSGTGTNWCQNAATYLEPVGARPPFKCRANGTMISGKQSRCIRLNNYGCMWQRGKTWPGTDMKPGNTGAHDGANMSINNGHSVFRDPIASIAAKFHWFASRGERSALSHAEKYLPWCDTLGSKPQKNGFYRGCDLKPHQRVSGRRYCERPANGSPTAAQCKACNCPSVLAQKWVEGTGYRVTDKLPLVDRTGAPNELMVKIALRNTVNELGGYRPNARAVTAAIKAYPNLFGGAGVPAIVPISRPQSHSPLWDWLFRQ